MNHGHLRKDSGDNAEYNPVIKKRYLELLDPSLNDTLGDWQRFLWAIKDKLGYKDVNGVITRRKVENGNIKNRKNFA